MRVTVLTWSRQSKRPKSAMAALYSAKCFYAWDNHTVSTVKNCHNYVVFITHSFSGNLSSQKTFTWIENVFRTDSLRNGKCACRFRVSSQAAGFSETLVNYLIIYVKLQHCKNIKSQTLISYISISDRLQYFWRLIYLRSNKAVSWYDCTVSNDSGISEK